MLRMLFVVMTLVWAASSASALENAYERGVSEFMYNQCMEQALAKRRTTQPQLSMENVRSAAAKDCEAQLPSFLKTIDGMTVKDRYRQCLYDAMGKHSSAIPPSSYQKTRLSAFQDCKDLELRYLDLKPADTSTPDAKRVISELRSEHLTGDAVKYGIYTRTIGETLAMLLAAKAKCENVNIRNISARIKPMAKILTTYLEVSEEELFDRETIFNPLMEIDSKIEGIGQKSWCAAHCTTVRGENGF